MNDNEKMVYVIVSNRQSNNRLRLLETVLDHIDGCKIKFADSFLLERGMSEINSNAIIHNVYTKKRKK